MIIDMIFHFFSYTKQEKRLCEQRRLVPSRPFSTSLRRPLLFRLAGKEEGRKGALGYGLVRAAGAVQGSTCFIAVTNTRTYPTGAMVRAACYGTTDLQIIAFELLR